MNCGANVPTGVLLRFELDLNRARSLCPCDGLFSWESDLFRRWPMADSDSARGDEKMPDLGRAVVVVGPGDGEGVFRAKGLFRDVRAKGRPPFGAGALMA